MRVFLYQPTIVQKDKSEIALMNVLKMGFWIKVKFVQIILIIKKLSIFKLLSIVRDNSVSLQ